MAKNVTKRQAEQVLRAVAEWMGKQGYGTATECGKCEGCLAYDSAVPAKQSEKWVFCDNPKIGSAPTGREAAYKGEGPELVMDFDWVGGPHPSIVLEGGPDDWAIRCSFWVQEKVGKSVFVEPDTSWALGVYLP